MFSTEVSACSVTHCTRHFRDDELVINFINKNFQQNYYGGTVLAVYPNTTTEICSIPFWNSSHNGRCQLSSSPTDSNNTIIVKNGKQYEHGQVKLVLHKKGPCIQENSDHKIEIEVLPLSAG